MAKQKIRRDRRTFSGFDSQKLARIWKVLADSGDWLHIAEIARRSGINQATVRWYINHYFKQVVEEQRIAPSIRLRVVRLKPGADFAGLVRALEFIKAVKKPEKVAGSE